MYKKNDLEAELRWVPGACRLVPREGPCCRPLGEKTRASSGTTRAGRETSITTSGTRSGGSSITKVGDVCVYSVCTRRRRMYRVYTVLFRVTRNTVTQRTYKGTQSDNPKLYHHCRGQNACPSQVSGVWADGREASSCTCEHVHQRAPPTAIMPRTWLAV